jgi:hypothetical protein
MFPQPAPIPSHPDPDALSSPATISETDRILGTLFGAILALLVFYPSFLVFDRAVRPCVFPGLPRMTEGGFERRRGRAR